MKPEQEVVVAWMRRVLSRRQWTAETWARKAGLSPTTVTRAMQPSYPGVTSLPALDALAQAAGVPSPIDALRPDVLLIGSANSGEDSVERAMMLLDDFVNRKRDDSQ